MAYSLCVSLSLGSTKAGLLLAAQLVDTTGAAVGTEITTGFVEIGDGNYLWYYAGFPDGFRGGVKFYEQGQTTILAFVAVNPEEAEHNDVRVSTRASQADILSDGVPFAGANIDAAISSRSSHTPADVWAHTSRTLTDFGTLVSDIWSYANRTLTGFGTLVSDIWSHTDRTLTSFGTLVSDIWNHTTRTLTSFSGVGGEVWGYSARTLTDFGTLVADIWAYATRTLTGFGTLVSDIWGYTTRTLTQSSGGATAEEVWTYPTRTLTGTGLQSSDVAADVWAYPTRTLTQSAAQLQDVLSGSTITIQRGDTLTVSLAGLGDMSSRSKLWFTVKDDRLKPDNQSIIQIEETAGLLYLNGAQVAAGNGAITVDDAASGNITITLRETETSQLTPASGLLYDIQMLRNDGAILTLTEGLCNIKSDVTAAIS
ncbi:MAG: hypothetical protein Q9M13_03335 [Mariprofundales bacterium]|nr:hypothetical protein [Mariprofundales bacterium]